MNRGQQEGKCHAVVELELARILGMNGAENKGKAEEQKGDAG